ncbi:MAG: exo-alpha-sialidase [Rhodothermales bacterium]|nr:exo-alpha-sialidase [Rhodothermales bacterium]
MCPIRRVAPALLLLLAACGIQQSSPLTEQQIFVNGEDGYECFRIPAIVRSTDGSLLAFAEGRVNGCNDFGDVDIVLKSSIDDGESWSDIRVVANNDTMQVGNPGPVVDSLDPRYPDGRVFLFFNSGIASEHETRLGKGLREVHFVTSIDDGRSWSDPTNITESVHRPKRPDLNPAYNFAEDWRSYAITPGHALQLTHASNYGRILVPANHSAGDPRDRFDEYRSHAFFSDDHGSTWHLSESVDVPSSNEAIAAELEDGTVMQNIREQSGRQRKRLVAISSDGGATWDSTYFDANLPGPVCQASILSIGPFEGSPALLFSNPASTDTREMMTIRVSRDNGLTWPFARVIRTGPSAYSDLVEQANGRIGLLYEHGNEGGIHYARVNLDWLLSDKEN